MYLTISPIPFPFLLFFYFHLSPLSYKLQLLSLRFCYWFYHMLRSNLKFWNVSYSLWSNISHFWIKKLVFLIKLVKILSLTRCWRPERAWGTSKQIYRLIYKIFDLSSLRHSSIKNQRSMLRLLTLFSKMQCNQSIAFRLLKTDMKKIMMYVCF